MRVLIEQAEVEVGVSCLLFYVTSIKTNNRYTHRIGTGNFAGNKLAVSLLFNVPNISVLPITYWLFVNT